MNIMTGETVGYSVKELLALQDKKLDRILDRLEHKADAVLVQTVEARVTEIERHGSRQAMDVAEKVSQLEKRLAVLEKTQADNAYLVDQYKSDHERLEIMDDEFKRLQNGFSYRIEAAIKENNNQIAVAREKMFSRKEKIFLVLFAGIGAMGTIVSVIVLLIQLGHGVLF